MSRIDKMIIQGMRSFGPDDSDRGLIQFFTPLTLILGQNGTGKTTIIECLKYITTGEAPPGGRKDGAFIHDPKIAHEREVRGQVRLQFRDVTGQPCVVQRSIQATQKQKNVTTKTLDGLIQRPGPDGKKHSISSKCADLDREMVASLGVSKAVLENVIFCHQEESSWPLSEGKALKAKFDDIFASTRYVKALDCIRKFRQEQSTTIKVYQEEIKYLKQNKEQSTKLQGDLEETQSKLIASKDTVKNVQVKLEPIERDLEKANSRAHDIFKLKTKIEKLKSEKTHLENAVKELEENIQNKFTGSTEKLRRAYNDFQAKVLERQDKLEQLESKMEYKNEEAEKMRSEKSRLLVTQGKLEQEAERHSENITKRDDQIHLLANNYGLEGFAGEIREGSVKEFLGKMKTLVEDRVAEAVAKKEEYDDQVNGIQKKMDEVRELKTQLESKQKMKIDMMVKNKQEIKNINRELSRVDASADRLAGVERELKRAELALKERESSMDTEAVKAELVTLQREKTSLDQKLSELNSEMSRMQLDTEARTQVEMLKKDKVTKEEQIRKIKAKNEDSLKYLLGHMPTENLRRSVEDYASEQGRKVQQCSRRVQQLKMELSSKETNHKMVLEQLRKKEEELRGYEDKIFRVSESQNFDEGLERLQSKMKSAQDNMGALTGTEFLVRKYLNQLDQNDPPCPLCHRPFDTPLEVDELISELRDKLRMVPQKKETCEAELETQKTQYENMLQLKPVRSAMKDLQESDIPELKTKVKKLSEDIGKLRIEITERDEELEALQLDEATAKSMQPDMVTVDRYAAELRELDRKIAREAAKLSSSDTSRTMQQVNSERDEMQLKVETVTRNLDWKRQKLSDHSDKIQQLRANVNDKNAEKLRINADLQERNRLEENKAELESTNETFEREISDAKKQLQPLEARVKKLEEEKGEVIKKRDKIWEADREKGNKIKQEGKDVHLMHKEIERYKQEGRDQKLAESKRRMNEINEKLNYAERELEELTSNINKIRKDLDTQQTRERELSDNIQLRKKEEEIKLVGKRIEEEEEQLGGFDPASLDRKRKDLNNQLSELTKERHQAEGRQRALQDEIQRLKRELRTDMFKDAEDKYRDKMIALRTTELANSDLDKYYKALDRAIMTYHSHKMEEINKIIRDLWRTTYKGNDIETIEIRSDEDQGSGAAKTRRTYHYRVVMKKGDTALDMRGRCSAGQRVLASLIIRLALAETFCINCGILALDEPTTNLDRQNIESLAYALVEIIKSRSKQRNFQLVVITHDEEFVELLGKADYVDEFFKVDKDADGKSRIKRARIQDLHLG